MESFDIENGTFDKLSIVQKTNTKYVIVCGSTISGIGKGSCVSALGVLFQSFGLRVSCVKIDPYLNVDAGTMSPYEHGEVFVLDDGGEVDLDLGNYERTLRIKLTRSHNITSGKVFMEVINDERQGKYLGKTVQMVPHVTNKVIEMIEKAAKYPVQGDTPEICLVEIGGTVGDIESGIFFEAIRQLVHRVGSRNTCIALLTYVPQIGENAESKTKPTQHAIRDLKALGLFPDFLICRSKNKLEDENISKIAFFANLPDANVISCYNVETTWDIPILLASQDLNLNMLKRLKVEFKEYNVNKWIKLSDHIRCLSDASEVRIAICGKYIKNHDAYYSVIKSLQDASFSAQRKLQIDWLDCSIFDECESHGENHYELIKEFWIRLERCHGILVPGGFGERGVNGMIEVCRYARENLIPFLGICLGMQVAVIEFTRNVLGILDAHSKEFDIHTSNDVITTMNDTDYVQLGGTLRLGAKTTIISDRNSLAFRVYGSDKISERHRHRYEVNPKYINQIQDKGMIFSGKDIDSERMTICEIRDHPFFFASQFHPEFKTHPFGPAPCFLGFILTSSKQFDKFKLYTKERLSYLQKIENNKDEIKRGKDEKYQKMIDIILEHTKIINEKFSN
jgi:CTP synthase